VQCLIAQFALGSNRYDSASLGQFNGLADILMHGDGGEISIVECCATQLFFFQGKPERFYQVQMTSTVCAQAHDVAGIGWDLGFKQGDVKHDVVG